MIVRIYENPPACFCLSLAFRLQFPCSPAQPSQRACRRQFRRQRHRLRVKRMTTAEKSALAAQVRQDFLHAWEGYRLHAWGHDEVRPISGKPHDWYDVSLHDDSDRRARHDDLMGLKPQADEARELDRDQAEPRSGHLRQGLRDHHPTARGAALQLSAERRQAAAGAGR